MQEIFFVSDNQKLLSQYIIKFSDRYSILGIYSRHIIQTSLLGIPVFEYCSIDFYRGSYVFVDQNEVMLEYARDFIKNGQEALQRYSPYWMLENNIIDIWRLFEYVNKDKERFELALKSLKACRCTILFWGNCQTRAVARQLVKNSVFNDKYTVLELPRIWYGDSIEKYCNLLETNFASYVDYLFIQHVKRENDFSEIYWEQTIVDKVTAECKVVFIPNVRWRGYYPQITAPNDEITNIVNERIADEVWTLFDGYKDWNIISLLYKGIDKETILKSVMSKNYYNAKSADLGIRESLVWNKERDIDCEIKISDFIEDNIKKELLFESVRHPANVIIVEIARRLLKYMGISDFYIPIDGKLHCDEIEDFYRFPIYPSIVDNLGLGSKVFDMVYYLPDKKQVDLYTYMDVYIGFLGKQVEK